MEYVGCWNTGGSSISGRPGGVGFGLGGGGGGGGGGGIGGSLGGGLGSFNLGQQNRGLTLGILCTP